MRILIAEDDLASRKFIFKFLAKYGDCDLTIDGMEAVDAFMMALDDNKPYELICLDIMMPELDGYKTLKAIRDIEKQRGISEEQRAKVIMTTALNEVQNVQKAMVDCDAYAVKPIDTEKLNQVLQKLGFSRNF
jgi:two-component system, chemotaxis family, chemotaxis protein CheY